MSPPASRTAGTAVTEGVRRESNTNASEVTAEAVWQQQAIPQNLANLAKQHRYKKDLLQ